MSNFVCLTMLVWLVGMATFPVHAEDFPPHAELRLNDLDAQPRDLAEFRGKVVLVNFWASWCAPCREEMPALEELKRAYGERGFEIVAVNLAESPQRIRRFLDAFLPDGVPFVVLHDRNSMAYKKWGVRALPASFFIDRNGLERWKHFGELDASDPALLERIDALLK